MVERLKQIWSGFEATTSRHLTGRGVDNIIVPHRHDYADEDLQFLPDNFEAPSEVAFDALGDRRKKTRKQFFGRRKEQATAAPSGAPQSSYGDDTLRGMRATAMRTERSYMDYEYFLDSDAGKAARRKARKKFLGIF